jgi:ABC-2 type transport system ATP-binding protein
MLLEVVELTKDFGNFRALDAISFTVRAGAIVGLLGPNGAGKSTTVHSLLGFIMPSSGRIRMFGLDPLKHREAALSRVNFISPYVGFPTRLTVFENLFVYAKLYGLRNGRAAIRDLLHLFSIDDLHDKPFSRLSSGEAARVGLCKAFLNEPDFIILDEPLANLDPYAAVQVKQVLLDMQRLRGTTILYTTHNMAQAEELCDRVIFLDRGRIIADGSPIEVTRQLLSQDSDAPALREIFLSLGGRRLHETA